MSEQTPTPEQIAAWNRIASRFDSRQFDTDLALIEPFVSEALTNPQPALPTEPGAVIRDAFRVVWVLQTDGVWRHGPSGEIWSQEKLLGDRERAPFRRLVEERPPITREQIIDAFESNKSVMAGIDAILALVNGTDR